MSDWPGRYVIGLTGNIATGKSVVRKMLEHLGAFGIDADALSHRAIAKGAPGHRPAVDAFGEWILKENGEIDRGKLGLVVFADPEALARLEAIIHPLVGQAIDYLIRWTSKKVVVIEAIKLLESPLHKTCDTIWVTTAPEEVQLARLMEKRGMSEAEAYERMASQGSQEAKLNAADTVIENDGAFEDTWRQVVVAWKTLFPEAEGDTVPVQVSAAPPSEGRPERFSILRARPRQAEEIAAFMARISGGQYRLNRDDVMAAFGEKAYLLLKDGERLVGLIGWQVENLVARIDEIYLDSDVPKQEALIFLVREVEQASRELQSESALIVVGPELAALGDLWSELGYELRSPESLTVGAWQEAAYETLVEGKVLLFKQLRADRVLRPL
jgi:dephospho-CoA kinase